MSAPSGQAPFAVAYGAELDHIVCQVENRLDLALPHPLRQGPLCRDDDTWGPNFSYQPLCLSYTMMFLILLVSKNEPAYIQPASLTC